MANSATKYLTWIAMSWSALQAEVPLCFFQRNPGKQALDLTSAVIKKPQCSRGTEIKKLDLKSQM